MLVRPEPLPVIGNVGSKVIVLSSSLTENKVVVEFDIEKTPPSPIVTKASVPKKRSWSPPI